MIELNLIEKKQPLVLPTVLGLNLNDLNFKMLGVALVIYYMPDIVVSQMYSGKIEEAQSSLDQMTEENSKIKSSIQKDKDIKDLVDAYKIQVTKLQSRSAQVDEILSTRTNPK